LADGGLMKDRGRKVNADAPSFRSKSVEKARNALFQGGATNRLAQQIGDGNDTDIAGNTNGLGRQDRIRQHQFLEFRGGDARHRTPREHAMGDLGENLFGALLQQSFGGIA
jgi:hypothetical protein